MLQVASSCVPLLRQSLQALALAGRPDISAGSTPAALTSDFLLGLLSQHKVVAGFARAAAPSPVSRRGGRGAMSRDSKPRGASRGSGVSGRLASKSGRGIGFHRKGKKASKGKQSR